MVYTTKTDTIYSLKKCFIFRSALKMPPTSVEKVWMKNRRFEPRSCTRYRERAKTAIENKTYINKKQKRQYKLSPSTD